MPIELKRLNVGKAEAEAENTSSNHLLTEVFEDYLDVLNAIERDDRFIVIGRKGTGKSAIAQYYNFEIQDQSNFFTSFINSQNIKLQSLIQTGKTLKLKHALDADPLNIFKWIILVSMAELLMKNEGVKHLPQFGSLQEFFKVNSGFVSLGGAELEETILRHKGNVNIEALGKFLKANFGQEFSSDQRLVKAPFIAIIPELEKVLNLLLKNEFSKGNKYTIIFDDLDLLFQDSSSSDTLAELIRLVKFYNISFFNIADTDVKILIFIRPDQLKRLSYQADINKILQSYSVSLQWYTQTVFHEGEEFLPLYKFINDRIRNSLFNNDVSPYRQSDWDILIDSSDFPNLSSFKYVLDHTLYRPRDLINLVNELKKKFPDKKMPIGKRFLDTAIESYSTILGEEVINELAMTYSSNEIDAIINFFRNVSDEFPASEFRSFLKAHSLEPEETVLNLYKYGIIGIRNLSSTLYSHWGLEFQLNEDSKIIKHPGLKKFFSPKRNSQWW